jgi:signal transduction histidine kinase
MTGSLRFRLPALFLLGIVLSGIVAALIALRLFQSYTREQSFAELRREASGLAQLYAQSALRSVDTGQKPLNFAAAKLELATGDKIYYVGAPVFPGERSGLQKLPVSVVPPGVASIERTLTFEFVPPGQSRTYVAAAEPLRLQRNAAPFGALVVAKPKTELQRQWLPLVERLALAFLFGAAVAGILSWYLSRRITGPVLALSDATDEIAAGRYDVRVEARGGGEIGHLAERFNEMAARLSESEERERHFLMSVSHELRTPLTAIRGHVDALRDGLIDDPDLIQASLDVVAAESTRLERLVGDVLDLAKLRAHRFTVLTEEVDMGRLVERAYASFAEEARRRDIAFELVEDGEPPTIMTDGDRVLQVITNLLSNALHWTPDGGQVRVGIVTSNGTISVDVTDSGPGISQEQQQRIFRPFVSGDTQGTGLGLPIARELARALGGRVELDSTVGTGSSFRLVLPVAAPAP